MTEEADPPPSISTHDFSGNLTVGNNNTSNTYNTYNTPRPAPSPLFSIPDPPSNFTGRVAEIDELLPHFTTQDGRGAAISGLSGGGGVGKSALARVLAARLAEQFPDARIQIDLRGAPHPGQRPLTAEEALQGLLRPFLPTTQLPDDLAALQAILTDTLRGKRALLLLDNAHNAAQVRPLIPPAPCAVIVTSRTRIVLTDLGLYPKALGALRPDEARALLRTHTPLQSVPDGLLDKLARLCGALPLALNVSAALLATRPDWTPQHLLKLLSDERTRLQRLKSPDDPNLDVEASLSLSYSLLDEENKQRFRALGIFPAPFDLPALQALWELSPEAADEALGPLLRLSLVDYVPGERMPYKLHDLTRIYAESLLRRQGEEWDGAVQRHADYFWRQGWDENELYKQMQNGKNVLEMLHRLEAVWPHLQAVYERALANAGSPQADRWLSDFPSKVIYEITPQEEILVLERALAAARRLQDRSYENVHLVSLGVAYAGLGDLHRAIGFYEQALAIVREIGDQRGEGNVLGNLSQAYVRLGDPRRSIEFYEQQLAIAREIGDRHEEGNVLHSLGSAYQSIGESSRVIELYEDRLAIVREIGDKYTEWNALGNLGDAHKNLGDPRHAIELYEQQLAIAHKAGNRHGEAYALGNLGDAHKSLGNPSRVIEFYEQQLAIAHEIGDSLIKAIACWNMGLFFEEDGQCQRAAELIQIAFDFFYRDGKEYTQEREIQQIAAGFYFVIRPPQAAEMKERLDAVRKKAQEGNSGVKN